MPNRIDIDHIIRRALIREIGERLRTLLREDPELPASLRMKTDRLRRLEHQSPQTDQRWTKRWWTR